MDQRKQRALIVLGLAIASSTSQAGIFLNVLHGLALTQNAPAIKQTQQTPPSFRTLKFDQKTVAVLEPLLMAPGAGLFGVSLAQPAIDSLPIGQKAGLRSLTVPETNAFPSSAQASAPKTQVDESEVAVVTASGIAKTVRDLAGTEPAKALFEAKGIAPDDTSRAAYPKVNPLPAIHIGAKTITELTDAKAIFDAAKSVIPGIDVISTESEKPITVVDNKSKNAQDTKVSVVANNVDLSRVLSILSDQTKANLLLAVPVDTKLTVRLQNVRFGDALKHICTLAGLSYVSANGAFILGPVDKLKAGYPKEWNIQHPEDPIEKKTAEIPPIPNVPNPNPNPTANPPAEQIVAETYSTNYIDAQSLSDSIKALVGEGKLQVAPGPSQLSPSILDRDTQQTTGVTTGVLQLDGKHISRSVILRGPRSLVDDALQIARDLDKPRPQVAISVTIHDITDNALKELGVTWELGGFTINESPSNAGGLNVGKISRTGTSFTAALKGLEQVDKAKLLASPSVRVMDRERAFVLIGSRLKFPVVSSYSNTGNPIVTTQEEKVGVYLQVAPQIASDRSIMLTLYPQVSTVVSFVQIAGGSYPQIDSREAQTTLRVQSGETIVIGGLYKDEEINKIQQVPILAQLPFIGELFKNRKKTKTSSQVIITLSIALVEPE